MLIKEIKVECSDCGWFDISTDSHNDWDKLIDLERCPNCDKILAERL